MTRRRVPHDHEIRQAQTDPRYQAAANHQPDQHWREHRACADTDPELFYPLSTAAAAADEARSYCVRCPVAPHCLAFALDAGDQEGVWGNTLPAERQAMYRVWRGRHKPTYTAEMDTLRAAVR